VLAAVRLESVLIDATCDKSKVATARRLRWPTATVLVLDRCMWREDKPGYRYKKTVDVDIVEVHAPRLRHFRYKGSLCSFSFSPQPPELEQVDLDFSRHRNNEDPDRDLETFWRFARSFASTKEMRLRVNYLEDIAVLSEARRVELLPTFRRLRRLEVQGVDGTKGKAAALTILNLLRCCPVLSALRINLADDASTEKGVPESRHTYS
jgi:hypothetical protein